jgi:membrane fusion protein (multidrug efflux system)
MKMPSFKPRKIAIYFGVLALLGGAIFLAGQLSGMKSQPQAEEATTDMAVPPGGPREKERVPVKVAILEPSPIAEQLVLPASVEAWEDVDLGAKRGGTVEWLGPEEGDRISSGDVILRLDVDLLRARLDQAEAQQVQAEKNYERTESLVKQRVSQAAELDNALAQRDVARASVRMAEVELRNATLRAPMDGVIDRINVDYGEYVREGTVVAKLVQTDRVKVVVDVPEKDVGFLELGQRVRVFREIGFDTEPRFGEITYIALTADPVSRTFPMYVEIDNRDGRFRPGMIVRVGMIRRQVDDALTVPLYAVVDRGNEKVVYVENNGVAEKRVIVPGIIQRDRIQIVKGLQPGDHLIVVGQRDLVEGEEVEVKGVFTSANAAAFSME